MIWIPTIAFDFDGVIHQYVSPWVSVDVAPDPPVTGIREVIRDLRDEGYKVAVISSRCLSEGGKETIREYLKKYDIAVDEITHEKLGALVYIDDRAICFDGNARTLYSKIKNFKPWNDHE